jgi:hypothetical protein
MSEVENYDAFIKRLEEIYPRAMRNVYCGVSIEQGWYHIVERLVSQIHHHVKWKRSRRARDLQLNRAIKKGRDAVLKVIAQKGKEPNVWDQERADELFEAGEFTPSDVVPHIEIHQIKEKFGGLRFYFQGGDEYCRGLVTMAEEWAANTCEECGERGEIRTGGWHKSLCAVHHGEREDKRAAYKIMKELGDSNA